MNTADLAITEARRESEAALGQLREAAARVESTNSVFVETKAQSEVIQGVVDTSKTAAVGAHRAMLAFVMLDADRQQAASELEQAEAAGVVKLMQNVEFARLRSEMDSTRRTLDQLRAGEDRQAIATASQTAMIVQHNHDVARDKGLAEDPLVAGARDNLKQAEAKVVASLAGVELAWAQSKEGLLLTDALAQTQNKANQAAQQQSEAERDRQGVEKQAKSAVMVLNNAVKNKDKIQLRGRGLERDLRLSQDRVRSLQNQLADAEAELAAARQ